MGIKKDLGTYAIIGLAIIALAKPLAEQAGKLGASIGGAFESGLSQFVSGLSGLGGSQPDMTSMMGMPKQTTGGETLGQAAAGAIGTTAGMEIIRSGAADPLLKGLTDPAARGSGKSIIDYLSGIKSVNDLPVPDIARIQLSLENAFGTNIFQKIPTIGDTFLNFLKTGSQDISKFASEFKFPSGMTLNEILGAGAKSTFESPRPILPEAFGEMSPIMLKMSNLNIDKKLDTPYGVITTGSAKGSIGAGAGGILPPQNLTQVLQMFPQFSASQAADYLARTRMDTGNFDFGSNTGAGLISKFMPAAMTGELPKVVSAEINPVLRAYEYYKAMYGLM